MSLISGPEILQLLKTGVVRWPGDKTVPEMQLNAASLDLTLGRTLLVEKSSFHTLRLGKRDPLITTEVSCEFGYVLKPGEFILAHTNEVFHLPDDISAEYKLKSSMARMGIDHLNAGWCDAGWNGSVLTLELKNVSRYHAVQLKEGDRIGQVVFFRHAPANEFSYRKKGTYNGDLTVKGAKSV